MWQRIYVSLLVFVSLGHAVQVTVRHSDDLVTMACINSHFDTASWISGENRTKLLQMTQQSGFRTARDGLGKAEDLTAIGLNTIAQIPVFKAISYESNLVPWLELLVTKVKNGTMIPYVENANEPDLFWVGPNVSYTNRTGVTTYYPDAVYNELKDVYYYITNNSTIRDDISIIGPAWSEINPIPFKNNEFEPYVDYANYHPYPIGNCIAGVLVYDYMTSYFCQGDDPLNLFGYNYSANAYVYKWAKAAYGNKQFIMSETGYPTLGNATNEETQGYYFARLLFEGFLYNHKLLCFYEIWDSGENPTNDQQNYGIVRYNLTAKPAYTALQSILKLFADEGDVFKPDTQDITLTVSPVGNFTKTEWVHWFITQKRNGDFLLPIWHEVSLHNVVPWPWLVFNPPSLPFNLTLNSFQASSCLLYTFDAHGVMSSQKLQVTGKSNVISSVASPVASILQITPMKEFTHLRQVKKVHGRNMSHNKLQQVLPQEQP